MTPLLDLTADDLTAWLARHGQPAYRTRQIHRWVFERRAAAFDDMTDLPLPLRAALAAEFSLFTGTVARHQQSADGTEKLLVRWADGHAIECVLLRDRDKRTVCISTQVGCAMGCVFCASGLDGVARNLTRGEILEQLLRLQQLLPADERLSHIVVMGMGEPLANLRNLLPALAAATSAAGLGISARRITISTVGLPEGLRRLAAEDTPFHLAVSLHAPNDALRNQLVPVNEKIGLAAVLEAADDYFRHTGRRVTFEYVLLAEVNDRPEHARQLAALLRERCALLNVIPYNPVAGLPYRTPRDEALGQFVAIVEEAGIPVKVRRRRGDRIEAACGQLRRASGLATEPVSPGGPHVNRQG
jgi:23S rRNA (adenine2503-C2)-methyltransferase